MSRIENPIDGEKLREYLENRKRYFLSLLDKPDIDEDRWMSKSALAEINRLLAKIEGSEFFYG